MRRLFTIGAALLVAAGVAYFSINGTTAQAPAARAHRGIRYGGRPWPHPHTP